MAPKVRHRSKRSSGQKSSSVIDSETSTKGKPPPRRPSATGAGNALLASVAATGLCLLAGGPGVEATAATKMLSGAGVSATSPMASTSGRHLHHHHHSFSHSPHFTSSPSNDAVGGNTYQLYNDHGGSTYKAPGLVDAVRRISLNILNTSSNAIETVRSSLEGSQRGHYDPPSSSTTSTLSLASTSLDSGQYHRHHHQGEASDIVGGGATTSATAVAANSHGGHGFSSYTNYLANMFTGKNRWPSSGSTSASSASSSAASSSSVLLPSSHLTSTSSDISSLVASSSPPTSISFDDYEDDYYGSGSGGGSGTSAMSLLGQSSEVGHPLSITSAANPNGSSDSSEMLLMRLMRNVLPSGSNTRNLISSSSGHDLLSESMLHDSPSPGSSSPSSSSVVLSSSSSSTTSAMAALLNSTLTGAASGALTASSSSSSSELGFDYGDGDNNGNTDNNFVSSLTTTLANGTSVLAEATASTISEMSSNLYATYAEYQPTTVGGGGGTIGDGPLDWVDIVIIVLKVLVLGTIIFSAIFGNMLVIIAVFRHHRLRITTNYFIVSLALADILVAFFAMTFNASVVIAGRWVFNTIICDFWNSCDVLFSTASIMHLSCISYDRYYAIIKPLDYPMKITGKRVAVMLTGVWVLSAMISYIPIFTGLYTTKEMIEARALQADVCEWKVNIPYALISSTVSFWMPCGFMLTAYYKIYREAIKQEKFIYRTQQMTAALPSHGHGHHHNNNNNNNNNNKNTNGGGRNLNAPRHSTASETNNVIQIQAAPHRNSHGDDPESGSSTPTKRTISKMKREHKAAKTLGIIMGAFILCWLPFFIWYVTSTICGDACDTPKVVVDILFWVGYLNSAMNPIIYAYFNREFREAFKETLRNIFCCCFHFRCLDPPRSEAISFNCAYRSQNDVGMVESKYVKD